MWEYWLIFSGYKYDMTLETSVFFIFWVWCIFHANGGFWKYSHDEPCNQRFEWALWSCRSTIWHRGMEWWYVVQTWILCFEQQVSLRLWVWLHRMIKTLRVTGINHASRSGCFCPLSDAPTMNSPILIDLSSFVTVHFWFHPELASSSTCAIHSFCTPHILSSKLLLGIHFPFSNWSTSPSPNCTGH